VQRLEGMAVEAVGEAGGEIAGDGGMIRAAFDENSPGFWLDMLLLIERLARIVDGAAADLHGYSALFGGAALPGEWLCRAFSGGFHGGGVFLDEKTADALRPYVTVEEHGKWAGTAFFRLKEEKIFVSAARSGFLLPDKGIRLFEPGHRPSALVVGRFFEGKRDSLYRRIGALSGGAAAGGAGEGDGEALPPLFVRFGGGGLSAISDSWPEWIGPEDAAEGGAHGGATGGAREGADIGGADARDGWARALAARGLLFRHRLRREPSPFMAQVAAGLFEALLDIYARRAARDGAQPVVILENIHAAERAAAGIAIAALSERRDFILAGVSFEKLDRAEAARWEPLFPRRFSAEEKEPKERAAPDLPADLWEMGYVCALLGRVFPPGLIPKALEEMGKNSCMISRSISLLHALGAIDTPLDPRPWQPGFAEHAEAALGAKKDGLRAFARRRLFAWVAQKKISPCSSLLERIAELGGSHEIDDGLILQAVHGELGCSDGAALERFAASERLQAAVGKARAPALRYIVKTLLALHFGSEQKIRDVFACPPPECSAFPLLKTQALLGQSLYHLGWHEGEAATRAVKTATLLCQKSGNAWLSRCHRLFALASLSERRVGETNEYLGFALENAVKSGNPQEIGLASYYTASVQILHGNLSRSLTLAKKALARFLEAGSPEWADRARFLEGRIAFESGGYQKAAEIFEGIRDRPHGARPAEKSGLLNAWAYRSFVYSAQSAPCPRDRVPDTDLFELEALYFGGGHAKMAKLAEKLSMAPAREDVFYGTEQPDWRSGFAQCELLCFSWHDFRNRMLGALRSLAQSHVFPAEGKTAVQSMQQILQSSRFGEIDPGDTFYHYALYKILMQTGASQIDLRTAASMARKRMQVRSDRIDSPEARRQYLTQPYWNRALEEAARDLKLI